MINNSFYSENNINILKSIIKDEIKININKNHETIIFETMKYVEQNAGSKPPPNMSVNEYLFLMIKSYNCIKQSYLVSLIKSCF